MLKRYLWMGWLGLNWITALLKGPRAPLCRANITMIQTRWTLCQKSLPCMVTSDTTGSQPSHEIAANT